MLREDINGALKSAMLNKDKREMCTLRLVNAAIKDRDIAARSSGGERVEDDEIRQILAKMVKQRQESAEIYEQGGRLELAQQEREEIDIIKRFMPRQLSPEEIKAAVNEAVTQVGCGGLRDMGKVMAFLKERHAGQMDFGKASACVKQMLQ